MEKLDRYGEIVGDTAIAQLRILADKLGGLSIQHVNSTAVGGGVAEILTRMIPLLKELGVSTRWDVIKGNERFYSITKKMHNALHGVPLDISDDDFEWFSETNRENAKEIELCGDILFIHDPQPIALIERRADIGRKWIWRCHIDFSNPDERTWKFLRRFIGLYDCAIFSAPSFARSIGVRQILIAPSIDPLSDKNRELPQQTIDEVFQRFHIDRDRPVITQISRFDYLKDPLGVIAAYQLVKRYIDLQLILAGGGATDDPEGARVMEEVQREAEKDSDIHVLFLPPSSDIEINALQRGSSVVLQKSLREGFGLTVAEALWKGKPVIAGAVGGIPIQIAHKYSGILTRTIDGTAYWIKQLIHDPDYARRLGVNGREHIKNNFLITRHVKDYLLLFISLHHDGDIVYL